MTRWRKLDVIRGLVILVLLPANGCTRGSDSDDLGPAHSCSLSRPCFGGLECADGRCVERADDGGTVDAIGSDLCGGEACDGACLAGTCCPDAQVCGSSHCCEASEICFATACVTPGRPCILSEDCEEGQYCENGLGAPDTEDGGASCFGSAPSAGRCLSRPLDCADAATGEPCIGACEVRPVPGPLDAVVQWRWDESTAHEFPEHVDVWSTPNIGRVADRNCDGVVDIFDPPNLVFVSGNTEGGACHHAGVPSACMTGVLRVLDGRTGDEVWSLRSVGGDSVGFAGTSTAIGDLDHDGFMEVVAMTGEGHLAIMDHRGGVVAVSDHPVDRGPALGSLNSRLFGWGGGIALADVDGDGDVEILFGRDLFTFDGTRIRHLWTSPGGWRESWYAPLAIFADLDDDDDLEVVLGSHATDTDGTTLWAAIGSGPVAVADFTGDGRPEVVQASEWDGIHLRNGRNGAAVAAPLREVEGEALSQSGPPTVADVDGDGRPEIGVASWRTYRVVKLSEDGSRLEQLWSMPTHDFSSAVTGSTVFDFEGDGAAEIIYADECFLWIYDGASGAVRFAVPHTSFTGTEAPVVADVDGDGAAEVVLVSNGADPVEWGCAGVAGGVDWTEPAPAGAPDFGRPGWVGSDGATRPYRGVTVYRSASDGWVNTRTLWNQHAYSVTNICGDRAPCDPPGSYGDIPRRPVRHETVGYLNSFRQNVQGEGVFDAPDAALSIDFHCASPPMARVAVRNLGAAVLRAGLSVLVHQVEGEVEFELGRGRTRRSLQPGQAETVPIELPELGVVVGTTIRAAVDPDDGGFKDCRPENDATPPIILECLLE